ncbi:MAG TPA: shikimate dehydrogenase [Methanomassiliicoccales archaeon]|nr:shikimate dehydrogenase [Methanomassiliicoccales archaeon]
MICASIFEADIEAAIRAAREAERRRADLIEIRFDLMEHIPEDLSPFEELEVPTIATLRTEDQGGRFSGTTEQRLAFFKRAAEHFDLIDLELGSGIIPDLRGRGARMICSVHRFDPGSSVNEILDLMEAEDCDLVKGAFMVDSISDLHALLVASRVLMERGREFILIGMGELGTITRIRTCELGCAFTYASLEKGKEAAPGQLDVLTLRSLSRGMITGITGHPLSHSLSPEMHQAAFEHLGISGIYLRFPTDSGELDKLMEIVREMRIRGINVTIPHKEAIIPLLDDFDDSVKKTGAVNTVVNKNGRLVGMNTDVDGVAGTFANAGISPKGKRALVLGAGGAAKTCCSFLIENGARLSVVNRTPERAERLAQIFPGTEVLSEEGALNAEFDIVVNCTPLGMRGFPTELPIDPGIFREGQFVMDTIYNPPCTRFLAEAEKRGAFTRSGIEMLIYQAISAFEVWTGLSPPYEVMAKALREELE